MKHGARRRTRGITLIEMLITVALGALVMVAVWKFFVLGQKGVDGAIQRSTRRDTTQVVAGNLQKNLASGDLRFFAFAGLGDARPLARFLIPQVGACGDLSSCPNDSAYLYLHYDKLIFPAVTAICWLNDTTWLIDLRDDTYGPATFVSGVGFDVGAAASGNHATGPMPIAENGIVALMNPPNATLWRLGGPPTAYPTSHDTASGTFNPPLPPECASNLRPVPASVPATYYVDRLYTIAVQPFMLTQFTSGQLVPGPATRRSAAGSFPMRFTNTNIASIGRRPAASGASEFSVTQCFVQGAGTGTLVCNSPPLWSVPEVDRVRVDQAYSLRLSGSPAKWYEFRGAAMTGQETCVLPECARLPIPNNARLPMVANALETFEGLSSNAYSLLKGEVVSNLRFRLMTKTREVSFEIPFP